MLNAHSMPSFSFESYPVDVDSLSIGGMERGDYEEQTKVMEAAQLKDAQDMADSMTKKPLE